MTVIFLVVAIIGFLLTLNATRPFPVPPASVPSFFAGWLTAELAPQNLAAHVIVTVAFVAAGAVTGIAGWTALGLAVATAALLVRLIVVAMQTREVVERALAE